MNVESLIDYIKKQGFSAFILCIVIYWFNNKYDLQEKKIDELNTYITTRYENLIHDNTKALIEVKESLKTK